MFENRNLKHDLFALGLCALAGFLALALLTYNPADPVGELVSPFDQVYRHDTLVYPASETVTNICGRWGALAADMLLAGLGVGAYYLVASLIVVDVQLLRRREVDGPLVRGLGWAVSLAGLVTLASLVAPGASPGPVIGPGGYLGALGAGLLQMHFATVGGLIIVASMLFGGLLLCTDYAMLRALRWVMVGVTLGTLKVRRAGGRRGKAAEDDEQYEDEDESAESEPSVRIRGKQVTDVEYEDEAAEDEEELEDEEPEADEAEDEYEEEEDEEVEADEEAAEPAVRLPEKKKKLRSDKGESGPPLRVRRPGKKDERQEVMAKLDEASLGDEAADYELPDVELLIEGDEVSYEAQAKEVRRKAKIIEKTFANFGFQVKVVEIETGPVIAQYEVELEPGLRLSKITGLADDLAIALRVPSVRIVAPIPGKNTVGIEAPNAERQMVRLREVIEETNGRVDKMRIPIFLGKDVSGNPITVDLSTMPHLLIAGRTGTGKSVCLNSIICSMLMTRRPDEVRMLMIDPKMVELSGYGRLPHLMHPVVTDMRKAEAILAWAVEKMEERYSLLAKAGVRHITSYNQLGEDELMNRLDPETDEERKAIPTHLPFIVIVADEMADLMMTAGKEVEQHIIRLAQKSRAVGIHLILATQKPTVDVITGLIKSNLPARISFQVASRTDSRVVLDEMGADKLLGNGDMLFLWPGTSMLLRGQGTYMSDDEINAVVDSVSTGEQNFVNELVNLKVEDPAEEKPGALRKRDDLYEAAVDIVVREGRGSVSLLQRSLGIGYGRAARLVDFMAEDRIVGDYAGSQAREVLISLADWEQMQDGGEAEQPVAPPKKRRSNKIKLQPEWSEEDVAEEEEAAEAPPWDDEADDELVAAEDEDQDEYEDEEVAEDDQADEEHEEEEEYEDENEDEDAAAEYDEGEDEEDEEDEYEEDEYEEEDAEEEDAEEYDDDEQERYEAESA